MFAMVAAYWRGGMLTLALALALVLGGQTVA